MFPTAFFLFKKKGDKAMSDLFFMPNGEIDLVMAFGVICIWFAFSLSLAVYIGFVQSEKKRRYYK
jgi:hypothetical protein